MKIVGILRRIKLFFSLGPRQKYKYGSSSGIKGRKPRLVIEEESSDSDQEIVITRRRKRFPCYESDRYRCSRCSKCTSEL